MGVSLNRMEGVGLGVGYGLEKQEGVKGGGGGGGDWLREVELLRLVLRFSRGVEEDGRRADEAVEEEDGGRGEDAAVTFSGMAEALEQAEPGLPGAGLRLGLVSEPVVVGDETPA